MNSVIRVWGSLVYLMIGVFFILFSIEMKREQCSAYIQNEALSVGKALTAISILLFLSSAVFELKTFIKRRYKWRQSRWTVF